MIVLGFCFVKCWKYMQLYEIALVQCLDPGEDEWDRGLAATISNLHVNIAICNYRNDDWPGVLNVSPLVNAYDKTTTLLSDCANIEQSCATALKYEPTNVKALYWRAKYYVRHSAFDVAIDDLEVKDAHFPFQLLSNSLISSWAVVGGISRRRIKWRSTNAFTAVQARSSPATSWTTAGKRGEEC